MSELKYESAIINDDGVLVIIGYNTGGAHGNNQDYIDINLLSEVFPDYDFSQGVIVYGNNGADIIVSGEGDDHLSGGNGNDTFVYNFNYTPGDDGGVKLTTFSQWLVDAELPSTESTELTQNDFVNAYKGWLEYLVENWLLGEFDADPDAEFSVSFKQNEENGLPKIEIQGVDQTLIDAFVEEHFCPDSATIKTGNRTQERYFADLNLESGEASTLSSNDGHDIIYDFSDSDKLRFILDSKPEDWENMEKSAQIEYLENYITIESGQDFTADRDDFMGKDGTTDTKISIGDNWSVILDDYTNEDIWDNIIDNIDFA